MVILAEELLLLAYNDDTGRNQAGFLDLGLAGAVLLDLTLAGRLDLDGKTVVVVDPRPVGHRLLDEAVQRIAADKPRRPKAWIDRMQRGLPRQVLDGLVAAGVLTHDTDRVLGFIPFNRYRPVDATVEVAVRQRLDRAVAMGAVEDARTAALAGLVYALGMEKHAVPGRPRREVRRGLKAIAEGSWAAEATAAAVAATQAAVMAAVTAAVAASTAAAASGGG